MRPAVQPDLRDEQARSARRASSRSSAVWRVGHGVGRRRRRGSARSATRRSSGGERVVAGSTSTPGGGRRRRSGSPGGCSRAPTRQPRVAREHLVDRSQRRRVAGVGARRLGERRGRGVDPVGVRRRARRPVRGRRPGTRWSRWRRPSRGSCGSSGCARAARRGRASSPSVLSRWVDEQRSRRPPNTRHAATATAPNRRMRPGVPANGVGDRAARGPRVGAPAGWRPSARCARRYVVVGRRGFVGDRSPESAVGRDRRR